MKQQSAWRLWLLVLAWWAGPANAAFIGGHGYVSLTNWATANGLKWGRAKPGEEFILTNRTTRLVFDKDSPTAEINGLNVALSFPIAVDKGEGCIAQLDLTKTVGPLLATASVGPKKITTICLDPGHGGKDCGNRIGSHSEKTYTLLLANELRDQLKKAGFKVVLTRTNDVFVDLPARPALANHRQADLFVSLHFNGAPADASHVAGAETYCITPVGASSSNAQGEGANYGLVTANGVEKKSLLLAYQVQAALVRNYGANDRSVRRARFAVLRDATMPAILVESGYLSHPAESKKIFDANYRRQIATAIVKGILNYQKLTAPALPPSPPVTTNATNKTPGLKRQP